MNNSDTHITPGRIIALWRILLVAHKHKGSTIRDIYKAVLNSSVMGGDLPLKSGIQIGIDYKFLIPKENKLYLSDFSIVELISKHQNVEPSLGVLRKIFRYIIRDKVVPWIIYFNLDVEVFKVSIPNNWLEVLEMANLFNFQDGEVLDWWHSIIKEKTEINDAKLKSIGIIGEKLTVDFEISRLTTDNTLDANRSVVWVSLISDEFGYDVISKSGVLYGSEKRNENIYIEVKSSELSNPSLFTFYITENEWNKAKELGDKYWFYCWPGIKLSEKTSIHNTPFIIPSNRIAGILPKNISNLCEWVKCRLSVDLKQFSLALPIPEKLSLP